MSEPTPTPKPLWRVGRSVPINVYCGDEPVCQCHKAARAAEIVEAMNAYKPPEEKKSE